MFNHIPKQRESWPGEFLTNIEVLGNLIEHLNISLIEADTKGRLRKIIIQFCKIYAVIIL